ncbi:Signal-peptide peptidase, presenilin aspartyl protease [uncultured archaeon]|nr:Signal-peptide peptidase, presenilin aspartyl protease [uncultured archaeon]
MSKKEEENLGNYVKIFYLFMLAQVIGVLLGLDVLSQVGANYGQRNDVSSGISLIVGILLVTVILLILIKFKKSMLFLKLAKYLSVFVAFSILGIYITNYDYMLGPIDINSSYFIGLLGIVSFILLPELQNLILAITTGVIGGIIGVSLGPLPMIIFVALIAVYDYIAVFKTKHMVTMAKDMKDNKESFAIQYLAKPIMVGTGDFAIPAGLSTSLAFYNPIIGIAAMIGSFIGFYFILFKMAGKGKYLPAIPPIVFFQLLFAVIAWLGILIF